MVLLLLSTNIYFSIGIFFVVGVCSAGRVTITTTYMNEMVPEKYMVIVTTLLNVLDAFVMVFQVCYYIFSRQSYPLYWFIFGSTVLLVMMITMLPESPKWYYARNRFDDARRSLYFVAKFNGSEDLDMIKLIVFDTEMIQ